MTAVMEGLAERRFMAELGHDVAAFSPPAISARYKKCDTSGRRVINR